MEGREAEEESKRAPALVARAHPVDLGGAQARQFEFSRSWGGRVMAAGTVEGEVILAEWGWEGRGRVLQRGSFLDGADTAGRHRRMRPPSALALCWSRPQPRLLLAAAATGHGRMYRFDPASLAAEDGEDGGALELMHSYGMLSPMLTSVHLSCDGDSIVASGDTTSVYVYDAATGARTRLLRGVHGDQVNICRFANTVPNLMLTCSFDRTLKMWDMRVPGRRPIYARRSDERHVMVQFSPRDETVLASAVDNDVRQYLTVDGALCSRFDIPRTGSSINFTRSYYGNGGDVVYVGSSNESVLHVCNPATGKLVSTFEMTYEGRRGPSVYVQSLRPCEAEDNRAGVLVFNRFHSRPYEIVDVSLSADPRGEPVELPCHFPQLFDLGRDLGAFRAAQPAAYADAALACSDGAVVRANTDLLAARWDWFRRQLEEGPSPPRMPPPAPRLGILDGGDDDDDGVLGLDEDEDDEDDEGDAAATDAVVVVHVPAPRELVSVVVDFLHRGFVPDGVLNEERAMALFRLCSPAACAVPRLADACERHLRAALTVPSAARLLAFAREAGARGVAEAAEHFCASYYKWRTLRLGAAPDDALRARYLRGLEPAALSLSSMGSVTVSDGSWLYVLGGYGARGTRSLRWLPALHLLSAVWTVLPTTGDPPDSLCWHAGGLLRGEGGRSSIAVFGGERAGVDGACADLYELDLATLRWERVEAAGEAPEARERHTATAVGARLYVFGGRTGGTPERALADLHVYDSSARRWDRVVAGGAAPDPVYAHAAAHVPGRDVILFFGGYSAARAGPPTGVLAFDTRHSMWLTPPVPAYRAGASPVPRGCHAMAAVSPGGVPHLAIFGGCADEFYDADAGVELVSPAGDLCDLWLLSLDTWTWTLAAPSAGSGGDQPAGRSMPLLATGVGGAHLFVWGGWNNEDDYLDDACEFDVAARLWRARVCRTSGASGEPVLPTRAPSLLVDARLFFARHLAVSLAGGGGGDDTLIRFVVEGRELLLSKLVLSARSPHVRALLGSNMADAASNEVVLEGVRLPVFLFVAHFLYTGDLAPGMLAAIDGDAGGPAAPAGKERAPYRARPQGSDGDPASIDEVLEAASVPAAARAVSPAEVMIAAGRLRVQGLLDVMERAVAREVTPANAVACIAFADYYSLETLSRTAVMVAVGSMDGGGAAAIDLAPLGPELAERVRETHARLLGMRGAADAGDGDAGDGDAGGGEGEEGSPENDAAQWDQMWGESYNPNAEIDFDEEVYFEEYDEEEYELDAEGDDEDDDEDVSDWDDEHSS